MCISTLLVGALGFLSLSRGLLDFLSSDRFDADSTGAGAEAKAMHQDTEIDRVVALCGTLEEFRDAADEPPMPDCQIQLGELRPTIRGVIDQCVRDANQQVEPNLRLTFWSDCVRRSDPKVAKSFE